MLDHPIIDIALGLVLFYVVLSLVVSAVQEWIASVFALRSKNLLEGIRNLVGSESARLLYRHPLIKNLAKENKLPSYIAPETMSTVLLEVLAKENAGQSYVACTAGEVREMVGKIPAEHPLKEVLEAFVDTTDDAAAGLQSRLADWLDEGMTRVSGWYKRRVKIIIIAIAAVVTVATNASTIHVAEELWRNDALRASIAAQAQSAAKQQDVSALSTDAYDSLHSFPIGWKSAPVGLADLLKLVMGWVITIAAISLGAPFWFDLLGKVANLRGSGGKTGGSSRRATS